MIETLKVLVVDDEEGMRLGIKKALGGFTVHLSEIETDVKFEVSVAATAEDGFRAIKADQPHLLLLDFKLPGMTGLDLLTLMSEKGIDILTIMVTAYASFEAAVEATKKGAYDFLAKPFSPAELKHMVRKAASRIIFKQRAQRLEQEKKKIRFEFISILSHELKSPLAAIQGYLNIMRDRVLGDNLGDYESAIERSLIRLDGMQKLIFDLLDISRIESREKKRELTDVNLKKIAEKAIETSHVLADEKNITIKLEAEDGLTFFADAYEMEIIFNNLVSNAVKYNVNGGEVSVQVNSDDHKVKVCVRDTGIGLTGEEAARLFKDFVRIKNDKTRNIEGSGLGLSVVKKLSALYGGDINVESSPGVGSVFTVELLEQSPERQ